MQLCFTEARNHYQHGWGAEFHDGQMVKCTWKPTEMDIQSRPVNFSFDLIEGSSPIIIGLDVKQHAETWSRTGPRTFMCERPSEIHVHTIHTYVVQDTRRNYQSRLQIVPHSRSSLSTIMSSNNKKEIQMSKQIHRFGHACAKDLKLLMKPTNYNEEKVKITWLKVKSACTNFPSSGTPTDRKKVSTTHINDAFNE